MTQPTSYLQSAPRSYKLYNFYSHLFSKLSNPLSLPALFFQHLWLSVSYLLFLAWRKDVQSTLSKLRLPYFFAFYNRTTSNERCVELAIGADFLAAHAQRTIEIGNVTPRYKSLPHLVIDKYEISPGVTNIDFFDIRIFLSRNTHISSLLSLSTFEHFGWDEPEPDLRAFRNAVDLVLELIEEATLDNVLITVPLGYNPCVDSLLLSDHLSPLKVLYYVRSSYYSWRKQYHFPRKYSYSYSRRSARAIAVLYYHRTW